MSKERDESPRSKDSKPAKKTTLTRLIFPREATAQEMADQINAVLKEMASKKR